MFDRFKANGSNADEPRARSASVATAEDGEGATRVDRRPARPTADAMRDVRARQREEYGGINWGAAFFGWLVAVGVAVLLTGLLAAAGAAIGLTESSRRRPGRDAVARRRDRAARRARHRLLLRRLCRRAHVALRRRQAGHRRPGSSGC